MILQTIFVSVFMTLNFERNRKCLTRVDMGQMACRCDECRDLSEGVLVR